MTMQNAPWENGQKPPDQPPPIKPTDPTADIEKWLTLAEGFLDRVFPKAQKFLETVQQVKNGEPRVQGEVVEGSTAPEPTAPTQPTVTADNVYAMMFQVLNMAPDDMTCDQMRTYLRDNKEQVMGILRGRLGA